MFFFFLLIFFFHILYKGKHLGIQQSLTWQTEEQRNIGRTGKKKKMKEREQEMTNIKPSIKVCQHEYWNEEQGHIQTENTQKIKCFKN